MAKKGSILVCDDEEIMRDVLETILSGAGYKVELAKTGEEAIQAFTRRPSDVVLMDVSMPGIGGLTALEELIKIDNEAVVLIVTAYATFDTAISAWVSRIRRPGIGTRLAVRVRESALRPALHKSGYHASPPCQRLSAGR